MSKTGFTIVTDHNFSLRSKAALAVISGNGVMKELFKFQGMYIYLVEHIFHIVEVYKVRRILYVTHESSYPGGHLRRADHPNFSQPINHVMPNEQLIGFFMNHTGCRGTSHTFRMDGHGHIFVN